MTAETFYDGAHRAPLQQLANPVGFVPSSNKRWLRNILANVTAERWKSSYAVILWRWVIAIAKTAGAIPPRR